MGGALEFTANLTQELQTLWDTIVAAYVDGKETGKSMWFAVVIPGLTNAFYFRGNPSTQGLPAIEVNSVLETSLYITPTLVDGWEAKPAA